MFGVCLNFFDIFSFQVSTGTVDNAKEILENILRQCTLPDKKVRMLPRLIFKITRVHCYCNLVQNLTVNELKISKSDKIASNTICFCRSLKVLFSIHLSLLHCFLCYNKPCNMWN